MKLTPRSLKWRAIWVTLLASVSTLASVYYWQKSTIDGWVSDVRSEYASWREMLDRIERMKTGNDPVLRDLARGEFGRGSSVDEWLAKHPPTDCIRHDNYVTAIYGKMGLISPHVVAEDGRLVHAGCGAFTFSTEFFTFRTEADQKRWSKSIHREWQFELAAQAAVVGIAPLARYRDASYFPPPDDQP
jgi:hypothetical protein